MHKFSIAIIGASGNIGRNVIELLLEQKVVLPDNLILFASSNSANKQLMINGHNFIVQDIADVKFENIDICVFNTEGDISSKYIPKALEAGAYVIDSSSYYRLSNESLLIVPSVNKHLIANTHKLYSHANCITSPIATVIAMLHDYSSIKRINLSTYQSVSGAGRIAVEEFLEETKHVLDNNYSYQKTKFHKQIAFNVIPQIGDILESGSTEEENKIVNEIHKIVDKDIKVNATTVRVPVIVGHSIALNIEFSQKVDIVDIKNILTNNDFIIFQDLYDTPVEIEGKNKISVGRLRKDDSLENAVNLWISSDNLIVGGALDSMEITKELINKIKYLWTI